MHETPRGVAAVDPLLPVPFRVARMLKETHDTYSVELEPPDREVGFRFEAGQFNMIYAFGVGEAPISMSGDPARANLLVHTIRAVGYVTNALRKLKRGDSVGVRGPFGVGWPLDAARGSDVVLVAGGIGLAPLRPVLYRLLAERERFGSVVLLYGARTPNDLLFRKELERWRSRFDIEVHVTVDSADSGWRGNVGIVTSLVQRARFDPLNTVTFMCGPEVMMKFAALEIAKRGVVPDNIYYSMERDMKCGLALCGRCQFGPTFVCKDGPVFPATKIQGWFGRREI